MLEGDAQAALKDDGTRRVFGLVASWVAYRPRWMLSLAGLPCSRRPALPALGIVAGSQQ
jgi:hypothetical protein